jgi:hypothetical protein
MTKSLLIRWALITLSPLAIVTISGAHDINGGSWELDEDLSANQSDLKSELVALDEYAMTDAMHFVKHHPKWPVSEEGELSAIGEEHAKRNHRLTDPELIERCANTFGFTAAAYYEAR